MGVAHETREVQLYHTLINLWNFLFSFGQLTWAAVHNTRMQHGPL